jgi:sphingolipid delta-4 desaturase
MGWSIFCCAARASLRRATRSCDRDVPKRFFTQRRREMRHLWGVKVEAFEWHAQRRRAILNAHPEVRRLYGHDATTAAWVVALAALQIALTFSVGRLSWPAVLALAYFVGAFPAHSLGVLVHEAGHNLVFRKTGANKLLAIVANVPLGAPAAIEFRAQHSLHHRYLGDADGNDTQAPTRHEARIVHGGWAKLVSFTFGRFYFKSRSANHVRLDRWMIANWAACLGYGALVLSLGGLKSFAFGLVAGLVAFGPHTLGARRISEHLTARRGQPTNSYYGVLNRVTFDVGYHVEHHDFPNIPWRRLRALHRLAPEFYAPLYAVRSWTSLIANYFFDPRYRVDQYTGMGGEWVEELAPARGDHQDRLT